HTVGKSKFSTIIEFSDAVKAPAAFSNNKFALKNLIKDIRAGGETALFDAVYEAVSTLEAWRPPGKKAIVALTDGIDNKSRRRVEEVIDHAKQAGVPLYLLGFGRKGELDETVMEAMARQTGGKYFYAENEQKLIDLFEALGGLIHDDGIDEESLR